MLTLPIFPGRPSIVLPSQVSSGHFPPEAENEQKRNRTLSCAVIVLALPIFPGSHPPSIVGANELNFCVRDGNRWTLAAINTNYTNTVYSIFSYLLVTHTGFEPMLTA